MHCQSKQKRSQNDLWWNSRVIILLWRAKKPIFLVSNMFLYSHFWKMLDLGLAISISLQYPHISRHSRKINGTLTQEFSSYWSVSLDITRRFKWLIIGYFVPNLSELVTVWHIKKESSPWTVSRPVLLLRPGSKVEALQK